jgi:DNA repair exonuclease SbcCD ATPase subunit
MKRLLITGGCLLGCLCLCGIGWTQPGSAQRIAGLQAEVDDVQQQLANLHQRLKELGEQLRQIQQERLSSQERQQVQQLEQQLAQIQQLSVLPSPTTGPTGKAVAPEGQPPLPSAIPVSISEPTRQQDPSAREQQMLQQAQLQLKQLKSETPQQEQHRRAMLEALQTAVREPLPRSTTIPITLSGPDLAELSAIGQLIAECTETGEVEHRWEALIVRLARRDSKMNVEALLQHVRVQTYHKMIDDLQAQLDELGGISEEMSLKLQRAVERRSKVIQTLSNMMEKLSTTADTIIKNIK